MFLIFTWGAANYDPYSAVVQYLCVPFWWAGLDHHTLTWNSGVTLGFLFPEVSKSLEYCWDGNSCQSLEGKAVLVLLLKWMMNNIRNILTGTGWQLPLFSRARTASDTRHGPGKHHGLRLCSEPLTVSGSFIQSLRVMEWREKVANPRGKKGSLPGELCGSSTAHWPSPLQVLLEDEPLDWAHLCCQDTIH